jgi:hypothetical protein
MKALRSENLPRPLFYGAAWRPAAASRRRMAEGFGMNRRHVAALALVILAGCGPDMTIINTATQRAEASAKRAEISAANAERAASQAAKSAEEADAAANAALDAVRRANDFEARIEAGASCSHGWADFAGEKNTCQPLSAADVKWINSRVKQLNPNLK